MPKLLYDWTEATTYLSNRDAKLASLIERVGDKRLVRHNFDSPYHALFRSIIYQQLSGSAAQTIYNRVESLFSSGGPDPDHVIAIPAEELRAAGMSYAKIRAVKDLAEKTISGDVPPLRVLCRRSDEEVIQTLSSVKGVGVWTAHMLLIGYMGRPDIMAASDLGVRKGVAKVYRRRSLPTEANLLRYSKKWKPYRSVVSWLMWRALEI